MTQNISLQNKTSSRSPSLVVVQNHAIQQFAFFLFSNIFLLIFTYQFTLALRYSLRIAQYVRRVHCDWEVLLVIFGIKKPQHKYTLFFHNIRRTACTLCLHIEKLVCVCAHTSHGNFECFVSCTVLYPIAPFLSRLFELANIV